MRSLRTMLLIALAALLLPGLARAAPPSITPQEYKARLTKAIDLLQAGQVARASDQLGSAWQVETTPPVTVDMRSLVALSQTDQRAAIDLLREHLRAVDAAVAAAPRALPGARGRLEAALKEAETQKKATENFLDWLSKLWRRIFGEPTGGAAPAPTGEEPRGASTSTYVALGVGTVGVLVLGWYLMRTLSANAGGEEVAVKGRKAAHPGRPLTPDELWTLANEEAAGGDFKEGLRLAHLALLQHLDRSGLLRYVPAQTNREHEWMLRRRRPDLAPTMNQLNDLVESRLYSGHGTTAEDFRRGGDLARQLWREGDAQSKSAQETTGASSSASSS